MPSNISFRIIRIPEAETTTWARDVTIALNQVIDSLNSIGSYLS